MRRAEHRHRIGFLAALLGACTSAAAPAARAAEDAEGAAIVAVPAVQQPLAAQSLVLDVATAGSRWVAVGERGHVLVSDDAASWRQVAVPVDTLLTAVSFADADSGWAVGHDAVILRSHDGGEHWQLQHFDAAREAPFLDVLFLDARRGYAVGAYGAYFVTDDGGESWSEPEAAALRGDELHLNAIVQLGDGSLLVAGESGLLALSSDGLVFERLESPYSGSLFGALAIGQRGALIHGLRGNAYRTDDVRAGAWTRLETGSVASLFGGARLADARVALVGASGTVLLIDPRSGAVTSQPTGLSTAQSAVLPLASGLLLAGKSGLRRIEAAP